jgi:hypothetical protein
MFDFIKKIIKPKEELKRISLGFDAIPGLLEERQKAAKDHLLLESEETARAIRNGIAQLQHIVNSIDGAQHDPALHPKLISIAKNSLPQFLKAMNTSLARELPNDTEEFYSAAVECVKGCLNSTRGQGRYLTAVFPDEMKGVKEGIDAIGHEINTLTTVLSAYHTETARIMQVRQEYQALCDIQEDLYRSAEKESRISMRIQDISARLAAADTELESLKKPETMQEIASLQSSCKDMEKKRDDLARTYASLSMTASHVLRKAGKMAVKQKHNEEVLLIHAATALLSDHTLPDPTALTSALASVCPIVIRMIEQGEISIKNREERALFSDPERFYTGIGSACSDLKRSEEECSSSQKTISTHPIIMAIGSLEREKAQLIAMREKEGGARDNLVRWRQKTKENIPDLWQDLSKKIEVLTGGAVQLQSDEPALVRG